MAGRIEVRLQRSDSHVRLEVTDTGVGIAAEHLPHIFERFRQVDSSNVRAHGGLGLGLAIVDYLVRQQAGTVCAESEGAGKGATFRVEFPLTSSEVISSDAGAVEVFSDVAKALMEIRAFSRGEIKAPPDSVGGRRSGHAGVAQDSPATTRCGGDCRRVRARAHWRRSRVPSPM